MIEMQRHRLWLVLLVVLAVAGTGCGGSDGTAEVIEEAVEEAGGDIDVDLEGDDEFTIEFEDEEGGGTLRTASGDIPDDFPMPLPDDAVPVGTTSMNVAEGSSVVVVCEFPEEDLDEVVAMYEEWFATEGIETDTMRVTSEGTTIVSMGGETAEGMMAVSISSDAEETILSLSWTTS